MTYVCSDIHGEYELFLRLLDKIRFSDCDEMIICGDVIDKGNASVHLLKLFLKYKNFLLLIGNHEYDFLKFYRELMMQEFSDYEKVLKRLQAYFPADGNLLEWDIMDRLECLPFYIEREKFICVHSGIPVLSNNTLLNVEKAKPEQLVYDRYFKEPYVLPETDKCIFFGHTPANYISGKHEIITYPKVKNPADVSDFTKIHLDIGSWLGGGVGCFCVDNLQSYYFNND